jgi:hypothetical protein
MWCSKLFLNLLAVDAKEAWQRIVMHQWIELPPLVIAWRDGAERFVLYIGCKRAWVLALRMGAMSVRTACVVSVTHELIPPSSSHPTYMVGCSF